MALRQWDAYMVLHKVSRNDDNDKFTCVGEAHRHNHMKCRKTLPWQNVEQIRSTLTQMEKEHPDRALADHAQLGNLARLSLCDIHGQPGYQDQQHIVVTKWRGALREAAKTCDILEAPDRRVANETLVEEVRDMRKCLSEELSELGQKVEEHSSRLIRASAERKRLQEEIIDLRRVAERERIGLRQDVVDMRQEVERLNQKSDNLEERIERETNRK